MSSFDQLTKGILDGGLSRRDSLKLAFGGVAAAAMSAVGFTGAASASSGTICGLGCVGVSGIVACNNCKNGNCYCFQVKSGAFKCGCNSYCSSIPPCSNNAQCGIGKICIFNTGCGSGGVCVSKCTKTCVLAAPTIGADNTLAA